MVFGAVAIDEHIGGGTAAQLVIREIHKRGGATSGDWEVIRYLPMDCVVRQIQLSERGGQVSAGGRDSVDSVHLQFDRFNIGQTGPTGRNSGDPVLREIYGFNIGQAGPRARQIGDQVFLQFNVQNICQARPVIRELRDLVG